jgi:hypothetical protein
MRSSLFLIPVLALAACGEATDAVNSDASAANVQYATAKYFDTTPRNVRVGAFKQTMLGTEYKAQIGRRAFNCHYFRKTVTCQNA